jgi:hypothetical protein
LQDLGNVVNDLMLCEKNHETVKKLLDNLYNDAVSVHYLIEIKAKPGVSRGRKATGLKQFKIAGLPEKGNSAFFSGSFWGFVFLMSVAL